MPTAPPAAATASPAAREQCDDGNTNNNDGCKNDCTPNVCGDGFVYRAVEQCDHGALNGTPGDACSATCALPPRTASADLAAGGTLTTDVEGDGATAGALVETWVTSPLAGAVSIEEGGPDPTSPSGYAFLGYSVHVTVPSSTAGQSDHPGLRDPQLAVAGGQRPDGGGDGEERRAGRRVRRRHQRGIARPVHQQPSHSSPTATCG